MVAQRDARSGQGSDGGRWWRLLLLFDLRPLWLDATLTVLVVAVLAWTRLAWLASGPWEWDETLFAHGLVKLSLAAHFPHPPGFPGWLGIGHLILPFAESPLQALQIGSALLSTLALWPLCWLGRKVTTAELAVLSAMLVLLLPGPWLHAVRGFSSTPAAFFAISAGALAAHGLQGRRLTVFTLLLACAFLVRPILLPPLALLWISVAAFQRPIRRLVPGLVMAGVAVGVSVTVLAWAEGGWAAFGRAFMTHGSRHFSRLVENSGGWVELGLVKGAGGPVAALTLLGVVVVGLSTWWQRCGWRSATLLLALPAALALQLLLVQNRTYTRYAVVVHLALAPLIAGAAARLPRWIATCLLSLVLLVVGWQSLPLVVEQRQTLLPGWNAVRTAAVEARGRQMTVVVEAGLHPYASYRWHWKGRGELAADPRLVLSPWAPEPWLGVDQPYLVATDHPRWYLDPLIGGRRDYGGVSERLRPLTQQRFLEAAVLASPPLPVRGWWPTETLPSGERFMWGRPGAALELAPLPSGTWLELDLRPARGEADLLVEVNGRQATVLDGGSARSRVWIDPGLLHEGRSQRIVLDRASAYPPGGDDSRPLSVQLFACWAIGPGVTWKADLAEQGSRRRARARLEGAYATEVFGEHGKAVWLGPEARLELPAGVGRLSLRAWAPRPTDPELGIGVCGSPVQPVELQGRPSDVMIMIEPHHLNRCQSRPGARAGKALIEIRSVPFVPAEHGPSSDQRRLGVVLQSASFVPEDAAAQRLAWR